MRFLRRSHLVVCDSKYAAFRQPGFRSQNGKCEHGGRASQQSRRRKITVCSVSHRHSSTRLVHGTSATSWPAACARLSGMNIVVDIRQASKPVCKPNRRPARMAVVNDPSNPNINPGRRMANSFMPNVFIETICAQKKRMGFTVMRAHEGRTPISDKVPFLRHRFRQDRDNRSPQMSPA